MAGSWPDRNEPTKSPAGRGQEKRKRTAWKRPSTDPVNPPSLVGVDPGFEDSDQILSFSDDELKEF